MICRGMQVGWLGQRNTRLGHGVMVNNISTSPTIRIGHRIDNIPQWRTDFYMVFYFYFSVTHDVRYYAVRCTILRIFSRHRCLNVVCGEWQLWLWRWLWRSSLRLSSNANALAASLRQWCIECWRVFILSRNVQTVLNFCLQSTTHPYIVATYLVKYSIEADPKVWRWASTGLSPMADPSGDLSSARRSASQANNSP